MVLTGIELTEVEQEILLDVAEQSARGALANGDWCDPHADWYPAELRSVRACFASLRSANDLLGSIGTTEPQQPLVIDAARNAYDVASLVARRTQLADAVRGKLTLDIAVLSPLRFLAESTLAEVANRLEPGSQGVHVRHLDRAATFLPTMWAQYGNPEEFLRQLCSRAKIDSEAWPSGLQVATFTTQCFSRILDEAQSKPLPR